jgi:hypothetical protein
MNEKSCNLTLLKDQMSETRLRTYSNIIANETNRDEIDEDVITAPDGGFGWFVVSGQFLIMGNSYIIILI